MFSKNRGPWQILEEYKHGQYRFDPIKELPTTFFDAPCVINEASELILQNMVKSYLKWLCPKSNSNTFYIKMNAWFLYIFLFCVSFKIVRAIKINLTDKHDKAISRGEGELLKWSKYEREID